MYQFTNLLHYRHIARPIYRSITVSIYRVTDLSFQKSTDLPTYRQIEVRIRKSDYLSLYQCIALKLYQSTYLSGSWILRAPPQIRQRSTNQPICKSNNLPILLSTNVPIYISIALPAHQSSALSTYQPINRPMSGSPDRITKLQTQQCIALTLYPYSNLAISLVMSGHLESGSDESIYRPTNLFIFTNLLI